MRRHIAYDQAQDRRRGLLIGAFTSALVVAALGGPTGIAYAGQAVDRHWTAEKNGDTAQTVAIKVASDIRSAPVLPRILPRTVSPGANGCAVGPYGAPVSCAAVFKYEPRQDGTFLLIVTHRDESFRYDSAVVGA